MYCKLRTQVLYNILCYKTVDWAILRYFRIR